MWQDRRRNRLRGRLAKPPLQWNRAARLEWCIIGASVVAWTVARMLPSNATKQIEEVGRMRQRTSKLQMHREYLARFGATTWAVRAMCAVGRRLAGFRAIKGMTLEPGGIDPVYLDGPPEPFTHHTASAWDFASLPGADTLAHAEFYEGAAERGDWCHYIRHEDAIASYGWYATRPVHALDDAWIDFSPQYVYMYKGFTVPEFRGRQLHAYGMAAATRDAVARGCRGLISFVEIQNESSLRSVARLGYRTFGSSFKVRVLGRTHTLHTGGCSPYGFRLFVPSNTGASGAGAPGAAEGRGSRGAKAAKGHT